MRVSLALNLDLTFAVLSWQAGRLHIERGGGEVKKRGNGGEYAVAVAVRRWRWSMEKGQRRQVWVSFEPANGSQSARIRRSASSHGTPIAFNI